MKTYQHTKPFLLIVSTLLLLTSNFAALAKHEQLKKSLPLECHKIPNHNEHLCFIVTQNPDGPFDDIVFYRMDKSGGIALLGSKIGEGDNFGGFDFSNGGKYMWLSWAEEGHPHFEFYRTSEFLINGTETKALKVLSDYYFDDFKSFTDDGEVIYLLADDAYENCDKAGQGISYQINTETPEKYCVKKFSLISR